MRGTCWRLAARPDDASLHPDVGDSERSGAMVAAVQFRPSRNRIATTSRPLAHAHLVHATFPAGVEVIPTEVRRPGPQLPCADQELKRRLLTRLFHDVPRPPSRTVPTAFRSSRRGQGTCRCLADHGIRCHEDHGVIGVTVDDGVTVTDLGTRGEALEDLAPGRTGRSGVRRRARGDATRRRPSQRRRPLMVSQIVTQAGRSGREPRWNGP
jgi:hypothetical protein